MTPEAQLKGFIAKFMPEIAALADAGRSVAGADLTEVSPFPFHPLTSSLASPSPRLFWNSAPFAACKRVKSFRRISVHDN